MSKEVPNKRYPPEFKQPVVETTMQEKPSYSETVHHFGVVRSKITALERICPGKRAEGSQVERQGQGSKSRPKELPKEIGEDLLAEVQRLRAENDQQLPYQGKAKGLAICFSQTASPFGCLNNFYFEILSNFLGSLHYSFRDSDLFLIWRNQNWIFLN